ncbi:hypothetical protein BV898_06283 [Hypsibius exemplaris]|uniref:Thyroglobulin type-1 domain-containing protein n=1 Tax=Hypsibius exemplaris TaxID=2072580 RepID=A0A1W0WX16_HYPEX|nr:hypothetical protein BV898_06283 [Hypsibius exemplaris]
MNFFVKRCFVIVGLLLFSSHQSLAQGPPLPIKTCNAYLKLVLSGTTITGVTTGQSFAVSGNPAMNKPGVIPTIGSAPHGSEAMVVPGKKTWVPKCNPDGSYSLLQQRVNGDHFCVAAQNGALAFEIKKAKAGRSGKSSLPRYPPYSCKCEVEGYRVRTEGQLGTINPMCDEVTGLYKPLQIISNQSPGNICVKPDGTRNSELFQGGAGTCKEGEVHHCRRGPAKPTPSWPRARSSLPGLTSGQFVSGNPAMNKPGLVPTKGANGETMVLPGKSTWVPQCQSDGTYATLQKRVNGNGFCVDPANGELTYDLEKPAPKNFWCGCFAESYRVMKERERGTINPMCDEKTGLYQPLQIISNQSPGNICVKEDGTRNSEPFMGGAGICNAGGIFVATKRNGRK